MMAGSAASNGGANRFRDGNFAPVCQELLSQLHATKNEIAPMQTCLKELGQMAKELGPTWKTTSFGSAASGFCTKFSDLDVTCYQTGATGAELMSARDALDYLHPLLQQSPLFEITEVISSARIPILKMRYDHKIDVDVSFQNTEPLANTQLLRSYAYLSPLVRHLVILVKVWANAEGVCGAKEGHLSSYAFSLLTLYFLQVDPMIRLPCFPTSAFNGLKNIPPEASIKWDPQLAVEDLVYRFFEFYATSFYWGHEVASVRTGQRLYSNNPAFSQLAGREHTTMLHVEDPFLLARNLNCVLGLDQFGQLCDKMSAAHSALQKGMAPAGFLTAVRSCEETVVLSENPQHRVPAQPKAPPPGSKAPDTRGYANGTLPAASSDEFVAPAACLVPMTSLFKRKW